MLDDCWLESGAALFVIAAMTGQRQSSQTKLSFDILIF